MPRYSPALLDHGRNPRNAGKLAEADAVGSSSINGRAPYTKIQLKIEADRVVQAMFMTFGCGVSIASASVLTEMVESRQLSECLAISQRDIIEALDGIPPEKHFCARLAVEALRDAIRRFNQTGSD